MAEKAPIGVRRTRRFEEDYFGLSTEVQALVNKALLRFALDPHHPSLRTRKMSGYSNIWEARVSRSIRFTFSITDGIYALRRVGEHDIEKRP